MSEQDVPYIVHESDMARLEHAQRRAFYAAGAALAALIVTNAVWIRAFRKRK